MMFQIERWAIKHTDLEDDLAQKSSFHELLAGLSNVITEIEKKVTK